MENKTRAPFISPNIRGSYGSDGYEKRSKLKIAFDVDDTLIIPAVASGLPIDTPNYETIAVYRFLQAQGNYMIVWSGGGKDYAERWAEKLGLKPDEVMEKTTALKDKIDLAFDDCEIDLAKVCVRVKRLNNGISRLSWNKHNE